MTTSMEFGIICCVVLSLVAQSCPTLCDTTDCSPPGSSVHEDSPGKNTGVGGRALLQGIFPTQGSNPGLPYCRQILYYLSHQGSPRILEWVAYTFSRGSSQPRDQAHMSCISCIGRQTLYFDGIFSTQGSSPHFLHLLHWQADPLFWATLGLHGCTRTFCSCGK